MRCRILNIGPDSGIQGSLRIQLEAEGLISLQHLQTEARALNVLHKLPESELPHIVLIPFQLPVAKTLDLIESMRSHQRLRPVRIVVWGPNISSHQIDRIYEAGAACVLPGQFDMKHLDAMRVFCRICTAADQQGNQPRQVIKSSLLQSPEKGFRNMKLGTLLVLTGCISAALWMCSLLQIGRPGAKLDLMPLPVYAALACAGASLMWGADAGRALELTGGNKRRIV